MKFSEMPYKRIDMEEVEKEYKSIIERTKNAKSGEEQFEIHREYYKFTADVQTSMEKYFMILLTETIWRVRSEK